MVNPDEFQLLMINSQNDNDQASLTINAHVTESTADISFLGVNTNTLYLANTLLSPYMARHFCKADDDRKVEKVQERALKIVYNTHSVEYSNIINLANLPSLQNGHLQDLTTLMYKVRYGLAPSNVVDIFSVKSSKYHLRNVDFHLPRFNSVRYGKHSIRYFGLCLYGLDWTAKSRTNLLYNPLSLAAYGVLTLWIL